MSQQAITYYHSKGLAELLERLQVSVVLTTYQAGLTLSIGCNQGRITIDTAEFKQPMGVCKTRDGLALATRTEIWRLPGVVHTTDLSCDPEPPDISFVARISHVTGETMAHEIVEDTSGKLWFVNTLFNCIATIEGKWNFVPQWKPEFIDALVPEDRCHLNGLSMNERGDKLKYVTILGKTNSNGGWRIAKNTEGCLIDVETGKTIIDNLCMPHSPRTNDGVIYCLNSGKGEILSCDSSGDNLRVIECVPGFARGMDIYHGIAIVGMSKPRNKSTFKEIPLFGRFSELYCGAAFVDLAKGQTLEWITFESGIEEIFGACFIPSYKRTKIVRMDHSYSLTSRIWHLPA